MAHSANATLESPTIDRPSGVRSITDPRRTARYMQRVRSRWFPGLA